jgi:arylsulfatase A-like enzyme
MRDHAIDQTSRRFSRIGVVDSNPKRENVASTALLSQSISFQSPTRAACPLSLGNFIMSRSVSILSAVLGFLCLAAFLQAADRPPNVVVIMADDLGFADIGCYGSEIDTPNLDALAKGGLRFNQFYNTAKCHSSRICLLSGLYMFQAGNLELDKSVTIAEVLRASGYHTMMSGKWHLNHEPTDRGFDRYFGHLSGATNFFTGDKTFRLNGEKFAVPETGFYTTDANTDYALEFLKESEKIDKPFFLYLPYNAPHYPLHVKESDFRKYENRYRDGWDEVRRQRFVKQQKLGILPSDVKLSPRPKSVAAWDSLSDADKIWEAERMAAFAGMVDCLDQNIGRVLQYLEDAGKIDNTIIMFCSDNGACPFERTRGREFRPWDPKSYWTYDTGWAHVGNTPFRLYKQNQHEGGITSPMIVSWSGLKTEPGSVTDQPAHLIDFMATCVDLAGADYPSDFDGRTIAPLQGKSLLPIFEGKQRTPHQWLYFQFAANRAIRKGDMKLVAPKNGTWELYDLASDRSELNDLIGQQRNVAESLETLWHDVAENIEHAPERLRRPLSAQ